MTPESAPEPERAPEARAQPLPQPEPKTAPSSYGGGADSRGRGEAYIPLPGAPPAKKSRWPLIAGAALLLAAGAAGVLKRGAAPEAQAPAAVAAAAQQVFVVTESDRDAEATALAQAALQSGKTTPASEKERQVLSALAASPESVRKAVADGSAGFYTFRFVELQDEGGDVFDIAVDGVTVARVVTSPQLSTLTIPLDPRTPHTFTETLVFARDRRVYAKGAPPASGPAPAGRASLGISSSSGEARSKVLGPGDSDTWTVRMGGGR